MNAVKKVCSQFDYNTLIASRNINIILSIILSSCNFAYFRSAPIEYINWFIIFLYYFEWYGGKYAGDICTIKDEYNIFIKNYNKMSNDFDLNNPVEMFAMYNFLFYKVVLNFITD